MLRPFLAAISLSLAAVSPALASPPRAPGPALPTVVQDDAQLIWHEPDQVRAAMRELRRLGVDWVRLTASWSELTRDPGSSTRPGFDATDPGAYQQGKWKSIDQAVVMAHEAGLKVMIDIGFWAPRWATTDIGGTRPRTNINPQEFRAFSLAVVRRYGGGFVVPDPYARPPADEPPPPQDPPIGGDIFGTGGDSQQEPPPEPAPAPAPLPKVSTFILWNEPNQPAFLMPQWRATSHGKSVPVSPHLYRQMVVAAYPAIKTVRSDVRVFVGNLSSTGGHGAGAVPPMQFLRALACVNRHLVAVKIGECAGFTTLPGDGWAQHPYALDSTPDQPSTGRNADDVRLADLPRLSRTLDKLVKMGRLSPHLRSIYITEFGYETQPIKGRPKLTEGMQARYLTWSEYLASRVPAVKMFGQFLLRDVPPAATAQSDSQRRPFGQFSTGLEHSDGSLKLATRSFVAGLYVQRLSNRTVLLWGRLRLGDLPRAVRFQRQVSRGHWTPLPSSAKPRGAAAASFLAPGGGTFARFAKVRVDSRYRVLYQDGHSWVTGLPVPAVDKRPLI